MTTQFSFDMLGQRENVRIDSQRGIRIATRAQQSSEQIETKVNTCGSAAETVVFDMGL